MKTINSALFWNDVKNRLGMDKATPFINLFRGHSFVAYDDNTIWSKSLKTAFGKGAGLTKIRHHYRIGCDINEVISDLEITRVGIDYTDQAKDLLTAKYLLQSKCPAQNVDESLESYLARCTYAKDALYNGMPFASRGKFGYPKSEPRETVSLIIRPSKFDGSCNKENEVTFQMPCTLSEKTHKYNYYTVDFSRFMDYLPPAILQAWKDCAQKSKRLNELIDIKVKELLGDNDPAILLDLNSDLMYTPENTQVYNTLKSLADETA